MMLPKVATIDRWAASLIVDFPKDNVPFFKSGDDWKEWGNRLVQETSFANSGAPGTRLYADWQTWAEAVFKSMANF